jgi:hypothetical protein
MGESMVSTLLIAMIGWPGIITSLGLSLTGIARKQPAWLVAGAIVAIPFSWYLNNLPLFEGVGQFLPLLQLGAAVAVHYRQRWWALVLLLPFISVAIWLAFVVLTQ